MFVKVPEPLAPVNKDETVRFECIIEANPKPTVNWFVFFVCFLFLSNFFLFLIRFICISRLINGKELTTKDGVQIEKDVNSNKYTLVIPKANPTVHAGLITIKAANNIAVVTHEITLNILGNFVVFDSIFFQIKQNKNFVLFFELKDSPKLVAKVENVNVNEGQDAEFTCKFISKPAAEKITWFKNETEELVPNENLIITNTEDSSVLKLISPKAADTGSAFSVKIVNQLGEAVSNKATLNVSCGPVFVVEPVDQSVLKDKEAKFECVVKSNPKPNLVWLFNGKEFTNRDGVRVEKDVAKDKYTLVIPKVTPAHIGTITAKATNEFGTVEKNCQLDVLDSPRILNKLDNLTVNEGEPAKFVVKFSGKPKPAIKWFKDDAEIPIDESIEIIELSEDEISFTIKSCKAENLGNYSAKAVNEFGEIASNKATLTINSTNFFNSNFYIYFLAFFS